MKEHGIKLRPELIKSGSFHREHAIEDATQLIGATPAPTAIFAANNILAEGVLVALDQQRLRVPRDVSVVAFDDVEWMCMVDPPLTTVRQPIADMARSAAELALRRLREGMSEAPEHGGVPHRARRARVRRRRRKDKAVKAAAPR